MHSTGSHATRGSPTLLDDPTLGPKSPALVPAHRSRSEVHADARRALRRARRRVGAMDHPRARASAQALDQV